MIDLLGMDVFTPRMPVEKSYLSQRKVTILVGTGTCTEQKPLKDPSHKFHLDAFLHLIIAAPSPSTSIFSFDI